MYHNLRPGVYARYDITGAYAPGGGKAAALILKSGGQQPGLYELDRLSGSGDLPVISAHPFASDCLRLLFSGGAGKVYAVLYEDAAGIFDGLASCEDIGAVICDEEVPPAALTRYLESCAAAQRECVALTGRDTTEGAAAASGLFASARVCVCAPGVSIVEGSEPRALFAACALAGAVLGEASPAHNFNGKAFPILDDAARISEDDTQRLLAAGCCVFERVGGEVQLIRALTTSPDPAQRALNTTLIIDEVLRRIRSCLRSRLSAGVTSPESIRDQVMVELSDALEEGILTAFDPPSCRRAKDDPGVCEVELSFSAAHLLSQVHITAHIRV